MSAKPPPCDNGLNAQPRNNIFSQSGFSFNQYSTISSYYIAIGSGDATEAE
jgi:hypothetical protein